MLVLESERDFLNYLDYLLAEKGVLDKALEVKSVYCKLELLRPCSIILVPEGFIFPRACRQPSHIVYFREDADHGKLRCYFSQTLREKIFNYENISKSKGYLMRVKHTPFTVRESDIIEQEERKHEFSPLQWVESSRDIEKQLKFFEKYPHGEKILEDLHSRMQILFHARRVLFVNLEMLIDYNKHFKKTIKAAIDAFSHLMLMDKEGFILTSSLRKKDFEREIAELMYIKRERTIYE